MCSIVCIVNVLCNNFFMSICCCYFVGITVVPVCFHPAGTGSGNDGKYSVWFIWTTIELHNWCLWDETWRSQKGKWNLDDSIDKFIQYCHTGAISHFGFLHWSNHDWVISGTKKCLNNLTLWRKSSIHMVVSSRCVAQVQINKAKAIWSPPDGWLH